MRRFCLYSKGLQARKDMSTLFFLRADAGLPLPHLQLPAARCYRTPQSKAQMKHIYSISLYILRESTNKSLDCVIDLYIYRIIYINMFCFFLYCHVSPSPVLRQAVVPRSNLLKIIGTFISHISQEPLKKRRCLVRSLKAT